MNKPFVLIGDQERKKLIAGKYERISNRWNILHFIGSLCEKYAQDNTLASVCFRELLPLPNSSYRWASLQLSKLYGRCHLTVKAGFSCLTWVTTCTYVPDPIQGGWWFLSVLHSKRCFVHFIRKCWGVLIINCMFRCFCILYSPPWTLTFLRWYCRLKYRGDASSCALNHMFRKVWSRAVLRRGFWYSVLCQHCNPLTCSEIQLQAGPFWPRKRLTAVGDGFVFCHSYRYKARDRNPSV